MRATQAIGRVDANTPEAKLWMQLFGTLAMPVRSPLPRRIQHGNRSATIYVVDVSRLSERERQRIAGLAARAYRIPVDRIEQMVRHFDGFVVSARYVTIETISPGDAVACQEPLRFTGRTLCRKAVRVLSRCFGKKR